MFKLDLDLDKAKKQREELAKDLEKVESKAKVVETRRKIHFIKFTSALASWPN